MPPPPPQYPRLVGPVRLSLEDVGGPLDGSPRAGAPTVLSLEDVGGPISGAPQASVEAPELGASTLGQDVRGAWIEHPGRTMPASPVPFLARAMGPVEPAAAAPVLPEAPAARAPFSFYDYVNGRSPAPQAAPAAPPPADPLAGTVLGRDIAGPPQPQRALPRLMGGPRRSAQPQAPAEALASSTGQPYADPGLVDAMTRSTGPSWQEPRETAYDRERRAIDIARQLEQQRSEMVARQAMDAADAEEAYKRRRTELEGERAQAEGVARDSYQRAVDRLQTMQVDPARYYQRAGVVGMLGNAIAVGLGAMGQALGGGPNVALDMMQQAIDRDLRAQEQDISTAGATADQRRGLLAEVRNDFTSREAALEASRSIALREAAARVEAEAALQGSAEAQANAQVMRDRLLTQAEQAAAEAQRAEAQAVLDLATQAARLRRLNATASQEEIRAQRMAGAGQGPARPERVTAPQIQAFDAMVASGVDRQEAAVRAGLPMVPSGNPITTEQRTAIDALDADLRTIEDAIAAGEVSGDIAGAGVIDRRLPSWLQSREGLRMRTAIGRAVDSLGRLRSGAAISAEEEERFRSFIEGAGTEDELRIGVDALRREIAARLGRGGQRASAGQAADAAVQRAGVRQVE